MLFCHAVGASNILWIERKTPRTPSFCGVFHKQKNIVIHDISQQTLFVQSYAPVVLKESGKGGPVVELVLIDHTPDFYAASPGKQGQWWGYSLNTLKDIVSGSFER